MAYCTLTLVGDKLIEFARKSNRKGLSGRQNHNLGHQVDTCFFFFGRRKTDAAASAQVFPVSLLHEVVKDNLAACAPQVFADVYQFHPLSVGCALPCLFDQSKNLSKTIDAKLLPKKLSCYHLKKQIEELPDAQLEIPVPSFVSTRKKFPRLFPKTENESNPKPRAP